jgi:hypothetical protein
MPVLDRVRAIVAPPRIEEQQYARDDSAVAQRRAALFPVCGNLECRSGWLHLWRSRQHPVIEGRWSCSPECTRQLVRSALAREWSGGVPTASIVYPHRVPLGLLLLSRGVITREELRRALDRQRAAGRGRLGEWLGSLGAADEREIAAALAAQWNCPVLSLENYQPQALASFVPGLFLELCEALPVRFSGRILYLAFESSIDPCLLLAVEKMTGARVEAGILPDSEFRRARSSWRAAAPPPKRLLEVRDIETLTATVAGMVEEAAPLEARLARVRDYFWLRIWRRGEAPPAGCRALQPEAVEDTILFLR